MDPILAVLIAAAAPVTAAVFKSFELILTSRKQKHEIERATAEQNHKITTEYLDRALKAETPIATRHALLRFLATKASDQTRLQLWAETELAVAEQLVRPFDDKVNAALAQVEAAKDIVSLKAAESVLQLAQGKRQLLLAAPTTVAITPEAIRAGFFARNANLHGLKMSKESLQEADLIYCGLMNADFSGANLFKASFQGSDLRAADFSDSDLERVSFYEADCRGANFSNASLVNARFHKTRLEKANLFGADLTNATISAVYDDDTIWPDGFDPVAAGVVKVPTKPAE